MGIIELYLLMDILEQEKHTQFKDEIINKKIKLN